MKKRLLFFFFLPVTFITMPELSIAQSVSGIIVDSLTREPLPFVNVWIKGTTHGTITNEKGEFSLDPGTAGDTTVMISFVGFRKKEVPFSSLRSNAPATIYLSEETVPLHAVVVRSGDPYARSILKKVIRNRHLNDPEQFRQISFTKYKRESVFLSDMDPSVREKRSYRKNRNAFIRQSDSTVAMPVYLSEQQVRHSINKNEKIHTQEVLQSNTLSIMPQFENLINTFLLSKISTDINFYRNKIEIMSKMFPGPITRNYALYYHIYLNDSTTRNNAKFYKFTFYPRNYHATSLKGYFWIDSATCALTEVFAELPNTANVNFVHGFRVNMKYQQLSPDKWFPQAQKMNTYLSFTGERKNSRKGSNLSLQVVTTYYDINYLERKTSFSGNVFTITGSRHTLSGPGIVPYDSLEQAAFDGINNLKNNNRIKFLGKFTDMTLNGYYNLNKIDFGSYMDVYRYNALEGHRLTLPLRTSEKIFRNFSAGGYVGYGFKDRQFKYGGVIRYRLPSERRTILTIKYDDEYYALTKYRFVDFIRENPYEAGSGNVISALTSTQPNPYMVHQKRFSFSLEYQLNHDIGIVIKPFTSLYFSNKNIPFANAESHISSFGNAGILTDIRFSFGQPYEDGFFYRIYYGNLKPVIHLSAITGRTNFYRNGVENIQTYLHLDGSIKTRLNFGPAFTRILINGGYIFGKVPYPLLFMPRGTSDLGFARYQYNLLYNASFAADLYTNLYISLNGGGILLNKLPLIRRWNLRESMSFKSFWGHLDDRHNTVLILPEYLHAPYKTPYYEAGVGITNIFKVLRIEYVRRLNQGKEYDDISARQGIRLRLEVTF